MNQNQEGGREKSKMCSATLLYNKLLFGHFHCYHNGDNNLCFRKSN